MQGQTGLASLQKKRLTPWRNCERRQGQASLRGGASWFSSVYIDTGNTKKFLLGLFRGLSALAPACGRLRGRLRDHTIGATGAALQVGRGPLISAQAPTILLLNASHACCFNPKLGRILPPTATQDRHRRVSYKSGKPAALPSG